MTRELIRDIVWGFIFLALQLLVFRQLTIFGAEIDAVLIFCMWQISRRNGTSAILICAFFALLQDIFLDVWGLNLFAKTMTVYILHFFVKVTDNVNLPPVQVLAASFLTAVLHNLIFLGIAYFSEIHAVHSVFWRWLLANSLYTASAAALFYLFKQSD